MQLHVLNCLNIKIVLFFTFSVSANTFQGKQRPNRALGTVVGNKEPTGFCANNDSFVQTSDYPGRFITHYETRYT